MSDKAGLNVLNDEHEEARGEDPLELFTPPAINSDYEKHIVLFVEPTSHITQTGPIVFSGKL